MAPRRLVPIFKTEGSRNSARRRPMTHDAFRSEIAVDGPKNLWPMALPLLRKVGFVELGRMGPPMAATLATAGQDVTGFVRHAVQLEWLEMLGVKPTLALSDLFDSDVVIPLLPDAAA